MSLDFKRVPQNSRTIIFEQFNDSIEVDNLCRILKGKEREIDDALTDVNEKLCVKSFKEFKEKFKPTVYEIFGKDENGELKVNYSLESDGAENANKILLCEHEFYKAVHDIAITKSMSNKDNNNIDYTKLYEALDPKLIYKRACERRNDVKQFVKNALEAKEKGNPDGFQQWMRMAGKTFSAVKEEYQGSALRMLPIAIRDTEKILESKGVIDDTPKIESGSQPVALLEACTVEWDSEGNLKTAPINSSRVLAEEQKEDKVLSITQKFWEQTVDMIPEGRVDKNVFLSVYSGKANAALANLSTEQLKERKEFLGYSYITAQQSFCNAVGYLVQKVADIEQFFIHAGNEKEIVDSGVIIANCSLSDVINNKQIIADFLKAASNSEKDKIWFAVLPAVIDSEKTWSDDGNSSVNMNNTDDIDLYDFISVSEEPKKKKNGIETVTMSDINLVSSLLAEYGILSFFNFNACKETSFKSFGANKSIIRKYNEEVANIKRPESTVLAYPNFTIIPKGKQELKEVVNGTTLWVPAIYIDAAYVAAGTVVATQNEEIQERKFGKMIKKGIPFISFDLEEEKNSRAFAAKFNPESRLNMDEEVADLLIGTDGNAFCFKSDSLENNALVFTARTLNKQKIYCFIAQQYFTFLLKRSCTVGTVNVEKAMEFAKDISDILFNGMNNNYVNCILHKNESLDYNKEKNVLTLKFKKIDEPLSLNIEIDNN